MRSHVTPYEPAHLPQLLTLVNAHLTCALPGIGLTETALARTLVDEPGQYVVNPWVAERVTLCAIEDGRVVAAAHMVRYGDGPEIWSASYRRVVDVAWLLAWPRSRDAGAALAEATMAQVRAWAPSHVYAGDFGLPVPVLTLVPESWPHVSDLLRGVGFTDDPGEGQTVYGGGLATLPAAGDPPVPGLTVTRTVGDHGARFTALAGGEPVGACEWDFPGADGSPTLAGWAELAELAVEPDWRNRGIGGWLLRHAAAWVRLAGCDRALLAVAPEDDAAGAGRFYRRHGLSPLSKARRLTPHPDWPAPPPPPSHSDSAEPAGAGSTPSSA